jgi:hypothetical protein
LRYGDVGFSHKKDISRRALVPEERQMTEKKQTLPMKNENEDMARWTDGTIRVT